MKTLATLVAACGCIALTVVAGCSSDPASTPNEGCVSNGSEALSVCAKGTTLKGIDVSSYQGTVSWSQVKTSGRVYAFARVSDGLTHVDSKFAANWPAMKTAGLIRGTYQFFRPGQDPAAQAKLLIDTINKAGGLKPGDLPPVLDVETADGQSPATIQARAKIWLQAVEKAIGQKPFVYTAAFMSSNVGTALSAYPLWVANYGPKCPTMPSGWSDWHFWQDSSTGSIPGISGNVDTDLFDGTLAQLQGLTLKAASAPPPASDPGTVAPTGAAPADGTEGMTLGSGNAASEPPPATETSAPLDPCASN